MLYVLIEPNLPWLQARGLGFLRVFTFLEFRMVLAVILGFATVILLGPRVIHRLRQLKIQDNPEFFNADLNELTHNKKATPTMGGILIVGAIFLSVILLADLRSFYTHMALVCLIWLGIVGGVDDYLKLTIASRRPGSRQGLYSWEKMIYQLGLALVLGVFILLHGRNLDQAGQQMAFCLNIPFQRTWFWSEATRSFVVSDSLIILPALIFIVITIFVITGASNSVNLTDGMDGLASGITAICAFAFMLLALFAGNEESAKRLLIPFIPASGDLSIVAGAMAGACLGFLWFNCHPAQVFMGDTGSLPLGGLLGYIAVVIRQEFLLLIIGGIFVMETVSVMMQVGYFKATKGKRIFRMAPIHHHFHLSGWTEQQVVVRFWLITAILAAIALATINLR
ncbi:MAG: phospho-N-acetylmuramoyl-pentapeptide-transferase [Phycisphaeraceae bacterium]|nr:phospho-N-acetylmuramoyl-pentapeptide-transferase [Phycisphaeraceae bacterium]